MRPDYLETGVSSVRDYLSRMRLYITLCTFVSSSHWPLLSQLLQSINYDLCLTRLPRYVPVCVNQSCLRSQLTFLFTPTSSVGFIRTEFDEELRKLLQRAVDCLICQHNNTVLLWKFYSAASCHGRRKEHIPSC